MKVLIYTAALIMMLFRPDTSVHSAQNALRLWSMDVVPSLFPYMVLCRIVSVRLKQYHFPAGTAAILLGFFGGSPSGSAILAGYAYRFPKRKLLALCAVTGTLSPMFLLGTAASWLPAELPRGILLISHSFGALLTAGLILISQKTRTSIPADDSVIPTIQVKSDAIDESIHAVLHAGGCIVFYSVLADQLSRLPGINNAASAIIHAFLEVSGGMHALSKLSLPPEIISTLIAGASGFTGISVLSQNNVFLSRLGIKISDLIRIGLLRAFFSACVMRFICSLSV